MRKTSMIVLLTAILILCYFTFITAKNVFRADWQFPSDRVTTQNQQRLVLITQERDTPFWDKVAAGARKQAEAEDVSFEVWGSYGNNEEDFLKSIEIAIQSKVDGIIVQGLDTDEFKNLTKIKASFYGIPIITVANDIPIADSLRRTYVGSDQFLAGKEIAEQLVQDMGKKGKVVLMFDSKEEYFQKQRLNGIEEIFKQYKDINVVYAKTIDTSKEQVVVATQDILNREPDTNAFIAINANVLGTLIKEISKRYQIEPYYLYSFDDGPESISLLEAGTLDAMVEQSPEAMGEMSVQLMMEWLNGEKVPLDKNGYLTDIKVQKANNTYE
ncbi:substrate-binding domain-containing protein [Cytobacillus oceanisediminis]|uniref:Sugar ABC transporter substrate-binding protein n=1 Tax=Niallia alba TaxID=2729105 RepID=A0A7Y0K5X0_9BACI|nr:MULTISPECIES: substrate-binding domain-containing protein [Bacillaceae]EOR23873.1 periplasmic binding protein/LacI transcriptional regulator [Niallia nealsonii AAU1]MBZ9537132.1 substrate-binding domain-containing protein [Cytobacillus oceanisediminis]MED3793061.1 substrate-binding domain-containing protein [Niallia alba]NMO76373.1 sugar ABC transporter substrate-binding protein [Niallia alba]